jgi:thiol-disulfide isomerase/thioredoxin
LLACGVKIAGGDLIVQLRWPNSLLVVVLAALAVTAASSQARAELRLPPQGYAFAPAPGCERAERRAKVYDDCADQMALFVKARAEAFGAKKQLLVVFGANWCPSCRGLEATLGRPEFGARTFNSKTQAERVHRVSIAISLLHDGRVKDVPSGQVVLAAVLAERPDVKLRAIPFIAAIDPVTGRTSTRNLDDLESSSGWNASAIATVVSAADEESRGGPKAPGEPGWLKRKWLRWFGP